MKIKVSGEWSTQGLDDTTLTAEAKDSEIKNCTLCLDNISKDFTINNMKKLGLKRSVKLFSVDFNSIDTNDILDISFILDI